MAAKEFSLTIDGYWRDEIKSSIPNHSGVYFVYEGTRNEEKKTVTLQKLIYIGEAGDVCKRITEHEKYDDWSKHVRSGNLLYFSTCPVASTDRDRVEAAYIFKHQPPVNTEHKDSFGFDETTIKSSGSTSHLDTSFTLQRMIKIG
ncbi:GIY-YIG nuclease family protein [Bacteroidota bacterium]